MSYVAIIAFDTEYGISLDWDLFKRAYGDRWRIVSFDSRETRVQELTSYRDKKTIVRLKHDWNTIAQQLRFWFVRGIDDPKGAKEVTIIRVELHCHGSPGILYAMGKVDISNFRHFSNALRLIMPSGGLVEFLSCFTAGIGDVPGLRAFKQDLERRSGSDRPLWISSREEHLTTLIDAYLCGMQEVERYHMDGEDILRGIRPRTDRERATWHQTADSLALARRSKGRTVGADVVELFRWAAAGPSWIKRATNGPLFCSSIAKASGCVIRAADNRQLEEGELDKGGSKGGGSPFGNWDGHVFDFLPDGDVAYVGSNVPRGLANPSGGSSFDGPLRVA